MYPVDDLITACEISFHTSSTEIRWSEHISPCGFPAVEICGLAHSLGAAEAQTPWYKKCANWRSFAVTRYHYIMLPCLRIRKSDRGPRALLLLVFCAAAHAAEPEAFLQRLAGVQPAPLGDAPPIALPVDDTWNAVNARTGRLERGLALEVDGFWSGIERSVSVDADRYNVLEVRMRADNGARCTLAWSGEYSSPPAKSDQAPRFSWSVLGTDKMHTYRWRLDEKPSAWCGQIDSVFFAPADKSAIVRIESFRFLSSPRQAPPRMVLDNTAMEAFFGSRPPWKLTVPDQAVFETHLGMLPRVWEGPDQGMVRFVARLAPTGGPEEVLCDYQFTPHLVEAHRRWVRIERSLAEYAGQEVTLHLDVEASGNRHGDYAYWGNPIVYSHAPRDPGTPVFLISCDTLRADHVSCYGYRRKTTPVLDRFAAEEAVKFEDPVTPEGYTLPAHMSMFTGLYPKNHKTTKLTNLAEDVVTLTELLRGQGYVCGGYTGQQWWMWPERGFYQGFDLYDVPDESVRHVHKTWHPMMEWLDAHKYGPVFLFFHNFDVHMRMLQSEDSERFTLPYDPMDERFRHFSKEFDASRLFQGGEKAQLKANLLLGAYRRGLVDLSKEEHAYLEALYDDCVRMVDYQIGRFFEYLRREGLYEPALIIVTADHGETLNERGYYGHNTTHEEVCRVPLIAKFPHGRHAGETYAPQVSLIDIYPTVADVLGIAAPPTDGTSLLALLENRAVPREHEYIERQQWQAVRGPVWKYHRYQEGSDPLEYLYNLEEDPVEMDDRIREQPETLNRFQGLHAQFFSFERSGWHLRLVNDKPWPVSVVITANEPIAECLCRFDYNDMVPLEVRQDNVVRWYSNRTVFAELIVRTASGKGALAVQIQAEDPFTVVQGAEVHPPAQRAKHTLDLEERDYSAQPERPERSGPAVLFWHVPVEQQQTQAVTPDEETKEQLRALGYLE